jgi:GNAT superfamily N-acetyltransferase
LLTARIDLIKKEGKVGLFAVCEEHQAKGIGSSLLAYLEQLCIQYGIAILQIPTQLENANSCKFYNRMGYKSVEVKHIYHYWS